MTDTAAKLERNVKARQLANETVELGITLAKEAGLAEHPESVRRMWQYVMEIAAELIRDKVVAPEEPLRLTDVSPWEPPAQDDEAFPFGKYGPDGEQLTYGQVPDSYYRWLSRQPWIDEWPDVLEYIQENNLG